MDYQKIAGDILFGADVLDNSMRGSFIEAVAFHSLRQWDSGRGIAERWHHIGLGWGPWDLQRGTARAGDRVRVQMKAAAHRQLWAPPERHDPCYELGPATKEPPEYFTTNFDPELIGAFEPLGYRADLFLLAWHEQGSQADPRTYEFYVLPVTELQTLPKRPLVRRVRAGRQPVSLDELPEALNAAADAFLASTSAREAAPC